MIIYLIVAISLVILGFLFESVNSMTRMKYNKKLSNSIYIVPSFLLLFFVFAFRDDFMVDYNNYVEIFDTINLFGFIDSFTSGINIEFGYILLNRIIGIFTSNPVYLFAVTTLIILYGFYHQFNRYSVNIWLSVLMFATAGSYYASFNITRQILAVAIVFIGSKYLYERKFFKYMIFIFLAFLFHKSALIMLPFYFILNFRITLKNLFLFAVGSFSVIFLFQDILSLLQRIGIYDNYTTYAYGMWGQATTNVVLPVAFLVFAIYNMKKLDSNNTVHRIWFNATIFYAVFNILALQIEMVERIGRFFAPYPLLLIPFLFSKMKNKNLRFIYIMVLVAVLVAYNFVVLSDSRFDPYYFIWDK